LNFYVKSMPAVESIVDVEFGVGRRRSLLPFSGHRQSPRK